MKYKIVDKTLKTCTKISRIFAIIEKSKKQINLTIFLFSNMHVDWMVNTVDVWPGHLSPIQTMAKDIFDDMDYGEAASYHILNPLLASAASFQKSCHDKSTNVDTSIIPLATKAKSQT